MNARDFAERAFVGVLLSDPNRIVNCSWLSPDDFHSPRLGVVYRHLRDLVQERGDQPIDAVGVYGRIAASNELGTHEITAPYLHTLMATAPSPAAAQPEAYGLMVLEASIRRDIAEHGVRVGQHAEQGHDLDLMLTTVERALAAVERVQERWEQSSGRPDAISRVLNVVAAHDTLTEGRAENPGDHSQRIATVTEQDLPQLIEPPDLEELQVHERSTIAAILERPAVLGELADRLVPEDFHDRSMGNTYRAAAELHQRGEHVDMVTVAWEQQRHAYQHGPGLEPDTLLELARGGPIGEAAYSADLVMRGSLARLTQRAAATVQEAAQHPGLQPSDLIHTTRMAYEAVRATAHRMGGKPNTSARLAGLSYPTSIGDALKQQPAKSVDTSVAPTRLPTRNERDR